MAGTITISTGGNTRSFAVEAAEMWAVRDADRLTWYVDVHGSPEEEGQIRVYLEDAPLPFADPAEILDRELHLPRLREEGSDQPLSCLYIYEHTELVDHVLLLTRPGADYHLVWTASAENPDAYGADAAPCTVRVDTDLAYGGILTPDEAGAAEILVLETERSPVDDSTELVDVVEPTICFAPFDGEADLVEQCAGGTYGMVILLGLGAGRVGRCLDAMEAAGIELPVVAVCGRADAALEERLLVTGGNLVAAGGLGSEDIIGRLAALVHA